MTAARQIALALPVAQLASSTATALILAGMGKSLFGIESSVGDVVLFIGLIDRFFEPIRDLSQQFTAVQSTVAASERVFQMIDLEPELQDAPNANELPAITGRVEVAHVTFGYLETAVLRDVSFAAEPGQVIALVGETGAGKSSIINLLVRFHDVWQGSVTYDGHDVRSVTQQSLRSQIALVLQDSFLFSQTVRENITASDVRKRLTRKSCRRRSRLEPTHSSSDCLRGTARWSPSADRPSRPVSDNFSRWRERYWPTGACKSWMKRPVRSIQNRNSRFSAGSPAC